MVRENILIVKKRLIMFCVTCFIPGIWNNRVGHHSESIKSCKRRGGLANSVLFRRVSGTWTMPSLDNRDFMTFGKLRDGILLDGDSDWVAGYAQFGEFYALEGCQDGTKRLNKYKRTNVIYENNIFECGKFCKDNTLAEHFGMYRNKCVCFREDKNNNFVDCEISNDKILYKFKNISLGGTQKRNFQCGMIEHNGAEWTQSSAKCLDSLSVMCTKSERETERTDTWIDAIEFCGNASDKMHSHLTNDMMAKANISNKYWLSTFRSFRVHDQYSQNTKACLSVTRTGNSLTLQPDDCGISQKYICANDIEYGYNNNNQGITTRQSSDKGGQPVKESHSPNITTGIVIGILAMAVVVSLIITGIICLRRRKASREAHKPLMSESSTATNVIKGTYTKSNTSQHRASSGNEILEEHEYASPEDVTDTNTVSSTNPNLSKIRPDKPARNTLRRNQKLHETYENFKLISTENRKVDENTDDYQSNAVAKEGKDEYDILCHNKPTPLAKLEHAEIHVYDHTTARNDDHECYDSTLPGRGNKHKPPRNAEDYDTVNISNNENVGYNKDALWNDAHNEEMSSFGVLKLDLTPGQEQEPVNI